MITHWDGHNLRPRRTRKRKTSKKITPLVTQRKCQGCRKVLYSQKFFERHISPMKLKKCPKCEKTFTLKCVYVKHLLVHPLECKYCKMNFSKQPHYDRHLLTHGLPYGGDPGDEVKTTSCKGCGKEYNRKKCLRNHISVNTLTKPEECQMCEEKFSMKCTMEKHLLVHPHECTDCHMRFTQSPAYYRHLVTHAKEDTNLRNGQSLLVCQGCNKEYAIEKCLQNHVTSNLLGAPEECHECKKQFSMRCALERHLLVIHPYVCTECEKEFNQRHSFDAHLQAHEDVWQKKGAQTYDGIRRLCPGCKKSFFGEEIFNNHVFLNTLLIHEECPKCMAMFSMNCALRQHCMFSMHCAFEKSN